MPSTTSELEPTDLSRAEGVDTPAEDERVAACMALVTAAIKREDNFRTEARWLVKCYEGELMEEVPFNILYANTETLSPALYNNTPRPEVKPRYRQNDAMPKASAELTQAYLEFFVDTGETEAPMFDELVTSALHEALVPGRGLTRFDFDADVEKDPEGRPRKVKSDYVCGSHVPYDRFCHGYAKRWSDVPWVCYTHPMTQDEIEAKWPEHAGDMSFSTPKEEDVEPATEDQTNETAGVGIINVYELWDKRKRKVFFWAEGMQQFLEVKDDPYKLADFFNCPKPLTFVTKISTLTPKALYKLYEKQARELNNLTMRISVIISAIKATGFYNSGIEGLEKVLELEDGKMHPLEGLASLGDGAALQNAVWMWPAEKLITVLVQLVQQRSEVKNVIYEITGISDILRGQSVASETATAQNIKNQWGGLRVKKLQKEVMRYVKECLRLAAELAFTKLSQETLVKATATALPPQKAWDAAKARVQQAQEAAQKYQEGAQAAQQIAQQARASGQPPPPEVTQPPPQPSPPSPNDLLLIQKPILETVLESLKSDLHRKFLIDIETNSTVDVEATEDKTNITEFLAAMAQFFAGIAPLVESGTLPWDAAKAMLLTISRKFRLGRDLDDELAAMQQPQPKPDDGQMKQLEQMKTKLDQQKQGLDKQAADLKTATAAHKSRVELDGLKGKMLQAKAQGESLIEAVRKEVKDTKVKAELEKLLMKLEQAQDELQQAGESVANDLDNQHERHLMEYDKAGMELDRKSMDFDHARAQDVHESQGRELKLQGKEQQLSAREKQIKAAAANKGKK